MAVRRGFAIRIDEYNVVVDDNPGQRDDTNARHDDAERLAHDQVAQKNATRGEEHGGQYQPGLVKTIELGNKNNCHDRKCHHHGTSKKLHVFTLVLGAAAERPAHPWVDVELRYVSLELTNNVIDENACGNIRINRESASHVGTTNGADLLSRYALDKRADRDQALLGGNS